MKKRIITGCESEGTAGVPYLTRWTLLDTRLGAVLLHKFHRSDGRILHDHPFHFISVILWRGYVEYTPYRGPKRVYPGMVLFRRASWAHRVELIDEKPAWTLVFRMWGFFTRAGWQPFLDYFKANGCEVE